MRFKTVVPLHHLRLDGKEPFRIAPDASFDVIPESLRADPSLARQSLYDLNQFAKCSHCLVFEYEGDGLGSPDPLWKGAEPRSIQTAKVELSHLVNLALWLQRPSPTGFTLVFHMSEFGDTFAIQGSERCARFLCHPSDVRQRIASEDLEPAKRLYTALSKIPRETAAWTALRAVTGALTMNSEEIRYLLLWVALEALFGANFEIKFRMSQRLAFFLAGDRAEASELFSQAKKAYDFRCKVAHGEWTRDARSTALTAITETLVRRSLIRILQDEDTTRRFLGGNLSRETYLDGLPFTEIRA